MKKSSMQQHELKKYVGFTVYGNSDKVEKNWLLMIKHKQFSILKTLLDYFFTGVSERSI